MQNDNCCGQTKRDEYGKNKESAAGDHLSFGPTPSLYCMRGGNQTEIVEPGLLQAF